jgi:hypothetical protein
MQQVRRTLELAQPGQFGEAKSLAPLRLNVLRIGRFG